MRHRLAVLMLAASLVGIVSMLPFPGTVRAQATAPGLVIPNVYGSLARGGQFSGNLIITRLSYRAGQLSADGSLAGTTSTLSAASSTPVADFSTTAPAGSYATAEPTVTPLVADDLSASTVTVTPTGTASSTPTSTFGAAMTPTSSGASWPADESRREGQTYSPTLQSVAISQSFRDIPLTLMDPNMGVCDVLHLDLGPVFLDQAGVQLDLAPAVLDMATLPRANRPVGNMLCVVSSLLEGAPSTAQTATLNELLPVINRALGTPPGR